MSIRKLHRALAAWLAILAVVIASVAPAISHAIAREAATSHALHQDASGEHDICGMEAREAEESSAHHGGHDPSPAPSLHMEHCPFCHLHADALLLPNVALPDQPPNGAAERPRLFFQAPTLLAIWRSAQPRAPPPVC